jgi:hypothetical protein
MHDLWPLQTWTVRILFRLEDAERRELNPHFQDDYRVAWLTVVNACRGEPQPFVAASYAILGLHPDKVWPAIMARRHAQLGKFYEDFWGETYPPKKPPKSAAWPLAA